jgi:hypothetical protein
MPLLLAGITILLTGGIALVSLTSCPWIWIGVGLIVASILLYIVIVIWRCWFSNKGWRFRTSDDKSVLEKYRIYKDKPYLWRTNTKQQKDMFFEIDFAREYKVTGFHFDCGYNNEAPIRSRFWFRNKYGGYIFPGGSENPYIDTEERSSSTKVELEQPIQVMTIRMENIAPDTNQLWRVEAVYVTIKTLFGFRYTIGKCLLDRL